MLAAFSWFTSHPYLLVAFASLAGAFAFLCMLGLAFKSNNQTVASLGSLLPDTPKSKRGLNPIKAAPNVKKLTDRIKKLERAKVSITNQLKTGYAKEKAALKSQHNSQLAALNVEIDSLKARLVKLSEYKLTLDIDTKQTMAKVYEGATGCYIFVGIRMSFDNSDIYPLSVKHLELTLQERNDAGEVREIESLLLNNHAFYRDDRHGAQLPLKRFKSFSLDARTLSDHYWFKAELAIHSLEQTELIKGRHFLRMTALPNERGLPNGR